MEQKRTPMRPFFGQEQNSWPLKSSGQLRATQPGSPYRLSEARGLADVSTGDLQDLR
jgi:hypothetical protein